MRTFWMVSLALVACASSHRDPRFGSLDAKDRRFEFAHTIELIEVTNGLRVAMIPDDTTNLVTVDMRYDVGAAEDPVGRTGMAHLVEHTMFLLRAVAGGPTITEELGELTLHNNAATSWDYTTFTATMEPANLEKVLSIEAQRMRPSCDAIDEAAFLRERDIVMQEDRERYTPLSDSMFRMLEGVYGKGHPYTRPIGSHEIATTTRAEICAFIETHYAPERANLVITGRIDPEAVQAMVGRTFGRVKRVNLGRRAPAPAAILDGRVTRHPAPVERPTVMVFFPFAPWGGDGVVSWHVTQAALGAVLDSADDDHAWITNTDVIVMGGERARVMVAIVEVTSADLLERGAEQVYARAALLTEELPAWAFRNLVGHMSFNYIASWDNRALRGDWIAQFMQFTDHNWFMLRELRALGETKWHETLPKMAARLVQPTSHVAMLLPSGHAATKVADAIPTTSHDVGVWRSPVDPAEADRTLEIESEPADLEVESYELTNGLLVQLAPDPASPVFESRLVFPVGSSHAPADDPYVAEAAALLLQQPDDVIYERKIAEKLYFGLTRGTYLNEWVTETSTTFSARGPALWSDWHVWNLSWRLDQGRYSARFVRAVQNVARQLGKTRDDDDRADPVVEILRQRLFGKDHPYAKGDASIASLARIEVDALQRWRAQHFGPRGATLVISGGFDKDGMKREVDELFGPWADVPRPPPPEIPPIRPETGPTWLASDRPGALQTRLLVAIASGSDRKHDEAARMVLETMLADELRVVREGMGATYGLSVDYSAGPAGGALFITSLVAENSAPQVLERILATVRRYQAGAAGEREAFVRARKLVLSRALAEQGGATAVASNLEAAARLRRSPHHNRVLAGQIAELTPDAVGKVAALDLDETHMVVLVRGKPASVTAAYERIKITPERPEPPEPAEPETKEPEVAARPYTGPKRDQNQKLYVGSIHAISGPREEGVFLNDRKLTVDEFLTIGGAEHIRTRMRQRRWMRRGMMYGGAVSLGIGIVFAATAESCGAGLTVPELTACQMRRSNDKQKGAIFSALGLFSAAVGSQIGKGNPTDEELRTIAADFNRRPVAITPSVTPGGAGLTVAGSF